MARKKKVVEKDVVLVEAPGAVDMAQGIWPYLAGVFDIKGRVGARLNRAKGSAEITVKLPFTDPIVGDWIRGILGKGDLNTHSTHGEWLLSFSKRKGDAWEFLKEVRPYLMIKYRKAECAMLMLQTLKKVRRPRDLNEMDWDRLEKWAKEIGARPRRTRGAPIRKDIRRLSYGKKA
jgi:hypothetical protein